MNDGLKNILRYSMLATAAIGAGMLVLILCLWPRFSLGRAVCGLLWGMAVALAGFYLICRMVSALSGSITQEKTRGQAGYAGRYLFYALCLFAGAWMKFSVLTMLGGILAQKASLVLYALKERKDCL